MTSFVPEPFNLIIVMPLSVTLFPTVSVPVEFVAAITPAVAFVPEGETVAPEETARLPLMLPIPAKVWPLASVKVWSGRPDTSKCVEAGLLPPKKISELPDMEPLPAKVTCKPSLIIVGPL